MKLRKLKEHDFIKSFTAHMETRFELELFESALRNYCSYGNPIRFNNFAFVMRELLKHVLKRRAPEELVIQCDWFRPDPNNDGHPTRRQQLKYCMQAGLQDNLLSEEIREDIKELINSYNSHITVLNNYTHINPSSYGAETNSSYRKLKGVISTYNEIMGVIEQGKSEVIGYLPEKLADFVEQEILTEIPEALDQLSTHTFIEEVELDNFVVDYIDNEYVYINGNSTVYVELNYGSDSDRRKGDGHTRRESFPVRFKCKAKAKNPRRAFVLKDSIEVINDSWYQ